MIHNVVITHAADKRTPPALPVLRVSPKPDRIIIEIVEDVDDVLPLAAFEGTYEDVAYAMQFVLQASVRARQAAEAITNPPKPTGVLGLTPEDFD